ncbi:MAG: AI-2E family transporter [Verrucomicrobiales bacterium]|nr:AI-2E family transporter [Verrucomicrobiales bacterium]MCP5527510.1 AI-2E family transporter [Verrucomicrobiales bacterium]
MNFPPPTERQARIIWAAVTGSGIALIAALLVTLVWGLGRVLDVLSPVLWPLAVAGVIAYLLDPVVDGIERRGTPRVQAIVAVFALAVLVLLGVFGSVVPQVVVETRQLIGEIPQYATNITHRVEAWIRNPPSSVLRSLGLSLGGTNQVAANTTNAAPATNAAVDAGLTNLTLTSTTLGTNGVGTNRALIEATGPAGAAGGAGSAGGASQGGATNAAAAGPGGGETGPAGRVGGAGDAGNDAFAAWLRQTLNIDTLQSATSILARALTRTGSWFFGQLTKVASWFGVLAGLALIPIYTFYFLLEKRGIESKWTDYLPVARSGFRDELVFVLKSINDYLIAFFRGQVLVAICDGVLYAVGFALIGLPYAVLIGVVATFLTIIPFVGAIITCGGALLIAVVQYGDWLHPLLALLVYAIVQALEGYVIQPKILGDRVGLHPLTIIVSVMVGTTLLGGILGGILAIPFTAALRVIMFRYVWKTPDPATVPARPKGGGKPRAG